MASNLNKGYQDIGTTRTRTTTRPGTPTKAGTPRQQVVTTPTKTIPATAPPKGKAPAKQKYERMVEKDTASHQISESRTEIKDAYEKFKADLDEADRLYFHARRRVDNYGGQGMVREREELQYAENLKAWQEENKARFKSWVDTVVERNKGNTKAPGTFNNMLDDAEEAFEEIDSRRPPEQYYTNRIASGRAARIAKEQTLPVDTEAADANIVSTLGGLTGPEATKNGAIPSGGAASLTGPDGKPLFTPEQLAASEDKSGYDTTASGVRSMFEGMIDAVAKKSGMSQEQIYRAKKDLDSKLEVVDIESQISDAKRKLEAKPKEDEGAWGFIKSVAGNAVGAAVDVGARGLDIISRPGYAIAGATEKLAGSEFGDITGALGAAVEGLEGHQKTTFSDLARKAYTSTGRDLDTWYENVGVAGVGLAADIATDPLTYVTFGTSTLGKKAALETAKTLNADKRVVKALIQETFPTVRRARKSGAPFEIATKVAKFEEGISTAPDVIKAAEQIRLNEIKRLNAQHVAVNAAEKQKIFDKAVSTVVKGDGAVYEAAIRSGMKPRLAVKFVGKDIGNVPAVGRAFAKAHVPATAISKAYNNTTFGAAMAKMFNMRAHFPGFTDRLRRVVEGQGLVAHQKFQSEIDKLLKGLTKEERRTLTGAIQGGHPLAGTRTSKGIDLGDIQAELKRHSDEMWQTKLELGLANPNEYDPNFVFHYYRGDYKTGPKQIKQFKLDRKTRIHSHAQSPTLAEAKAAGMKPYEDIGDILKLQHADHQRKLSKTLTNTSIVDQYGLLTNNPVVAATNGLVDVTHKLPTNIQAIATKQGKRWYVHRDIESVFSKLDSMHSLSNSEELTRFMRFTTRLTNWWKSTATIYNPGNWVNNSLGDLALNFFDGVQHPKWYKKAYEVVIRGQKEGDKVILQLGSKKITQKEAWELYSRFGGSAGFLRADVDEVVGRVAPSLRHKLHAAYQHREDFSRFSHFLYALEDEFKRVGTKVDAGSIYKLPGGQLTASTKPGLTSVLGKRIDAAAYAASDRVAKFNIDYSAFTPFERKLKGGAVPFYSWMRKAFPLMLENMFQRPGRYSALDKATTAVERSLGVPPEYEGNYNVHYPDWLRHAGFMRVSGGANPTVIKNPLPSNIIPDVLGDGTMEGTFRNMLSNLHPVAQMPIELLGGETLFSGAKIRDPESYLINKLPMFGVTGAITGYEFPGQAEWTPERRAGKLLGSIPREVDQKMQAGELRRQQDSLNTRMRQLNQEIYPIQIEMTDKGYKITNDENGRKYDKLFKDPKDAYMVALALKKQDGSPPGSGG